MRRCASLRLGSFAAAWLLLAAGGAACTTAADRNAPATPPPWAMRRTVASEAASSTPALALCAVGTDELRCADVSSMELAPVLRIVDGDTLHVQFDGRDESVRLYGIDAPEIGAPCADDATARLRALAGGAVRLRPDARDRDRYKRLLRYVYTASGESIDATLVREGLARAWRGDGELERSIEALETDARSSERGCLWHRM